MATEEDTFRALRKPSRARMRELWVSSDIFKLCLFPDQIPVDYRDQIGEFFKEWEWTVEEYSDFTKHD